MESAQWNGFLKKCLWGSANGCGSISCRRVHRNKCPSGYGVFLLARVDRNDSDDCGVCDRLKLF